MVKKIQYNIGVPNNQDTPADAVEVPEIAPVNALETSADDIDEAIEVVDPKQGLMRGLFSGALVPGLTVPLDKLQARIVVSQNVKIDAFAMLIDKPWKGYPFVAATNVIRNSLIFYTTPVIEHHLEAHGGDPRTSKTIGFTVAGALEGILMSPRTVVMQELYTKKDKNCVEVINRLKATGETRATARKLGAACRYGVASNGVFWPVYAKIVDVVEQELCVRRQEASIAKGAEEFFVGGAAGLFAATLSYPIYGCQQRAIDSGKFSTWQHIKDSWKQFGPMMVPKSLYKGYLSAAVRMPIAMGATNVAVHLADGSYHKLSAAQGLFKARPKVFQNPITQQESNTEFLNKMGTM